MAYIRALDGNADIQWWRRLWDEADRARQPTPVEPTVRILPVDPRYVRTPRDLANLLIALKRRSGKSYVVIANWIRQQSGSVTSPVRGASKTMLQETFQRGRLPSYEVFCWFVRACDADLEPWVWAYQRVTSADGVHVMPPGPPPPDIEPGHLDPPLVRRRGVVSRLLGRLSRKAGGEDTEAATLST
jgi:hypothetical protein